MTSPVEDPDTQFVGELLWAELYPNEMQPAEFNWMPLPRLAPSWLPCRCIRYTRCEYNKFLRNSLSTFDA